MSQKGTMRTCSSSSFLKGFLHREARTDDAQQEASRF